MGDVRDTAALHAAALTGRRTGHRRVFGPGRHLSTRQYVDTLRAVTGRRLPTVFVPGSAVLPVGRVADAVQRVWPWHIPAAYGAVYTCVCDCEVARDAPTLGIAARPLHETFGDTVRWMHSTGELTDRQAGAAVAGRP
jgi:nucleoside-diphosphate-sugar epimerase